MLYLVGVTNCYQVFYFMMRPHMLRRRLYIEMFNETLIMIQIYHLCCFSEFILDIETVFLIGYSYVGFIGFAVLVNLVYMIYNLVIKVREKLRLKKLRDANIKAH